MALRQIGPRDQQVQVFEDQVLFLLASGRGHFQADIVGKFGERADIADDHGLAQSQRALQAAGGFAHRGKAQIQDDVAGAHVFDEIARWARSRAGAHARCSPSVRISCSTGNSGCGSPTRIMRTRGSSLHQPAQRAQRFGDALIRLEIAEGADQRGGFVETQRVPGGVAIASAGIHAPCGMVAMGPAKPCGAHLPRHEIAVDDEAARGFEQPPGHGDAFVIGTDFERAHALREFERCGAAVEFALRPRRRPNRRAGW